jgi:hypothetical protein
MAVKFNVPFVNQTVDPTEPTSALMAIVALIGGFVVFSMTQDIGSRLGNQINAALGLGSAGQDNQVDIL